MVTTTYKVLGADRPLSGIISIKDGCAVLEEGTSISVIVWPAKTSVSWVDGGTARFSLINGGSLDAGDDIGPSAGMMVDRDSIPRLLDEQQASIENLTDCSFDGPSVVILSYVKDFPRQE